MTKLSIHRSMAIVAALAAVAFTASGVPDNKGTDAAIGWSAFLALALVFLVLTATAVVRRRRKSDTARARPFPEPPTRSSKIT